MLKSHQRRAYAGTALVIAGLGFVRHQIGHDSWCSLEHRAVCATLRDELKEVQDQEPNRTINIVRTTTASPQVALSAASFSRSMGKAELTLTGVF